MTASPGDTVEVHYTGTLDNGSLFDTSEGRGPLEFTVGSGELISGFDRAVVGMEVGDTRTVRIEPEDAYGAYSEDAVLEVDVEALPDGADVGDRLRASDGSVVAVAAIGDDTATLDLNHPLAGQPLNFEITLVSVD
ncbi:MAG: peptidylprolyl isomerase [Acidimicrobiia bacterium]|nr:peptidylprolyl isomerase [Acidimicrobiia bacterium]